MMRRSHRLTGSSRHGQKIFAQRFKRRRERDAQAQARHIEERRKRQEGYQPQAGDRDRPFRSASEGKESSQGEIRGSRQSFVVQKVVRFEKIDILEKILNLAEIHDLEKVSQIEEIETPRLSRHTKQKTPGQARRFGKRAFARLAVVAHLEGGLGDAAERRVALLQHHHGRSDLHPVVQVDDILVGHADAA